VLGFDLSYDTDTKVTPSYDARHSALFTLWNLLKAPSQVASDALWRQNKTAR
jgi:hypothetical protein